MITWWPGLSLEQNEKQIIQAAYAFYKGNKTATASSLGIAIRTLDAKLATYKEQDEQLQRAAADRQKTEQAWLRRQRGLPPIDGTDDKSVSKVSEKPPVPPVPVGQEVQGVSPSATNAVRANTNNNQRK